MKTIQMQMSTNARLIRDVLTRYKNTFYALKELINNSIQAKATRVEINLIPSENGMDSLNYHPIEYIQIADNGCGVPHSEFAKSIMQVATDNKQDGLGVGRLSALQIGKVVTINTTAYDPTVEKSTTTQITFDVATLQSEDLQRKKFNVTLVEHEENINSGYSVHISSLYHHEDTCSRKNKLGTEFSADNFTQKIFENYPLYVFEEKVRFVVNGNELKRSDFCIGIPKTRNVEYIDTFGRKHNVTFTFYSLNLQDHKIRIFMQAKIGDVQTTVVEFIYNSNWYASTMGAQFVIVESDIITKELCADFSIEAFGPKEWENFSTLLKNTIDSHYKEGNIKYKTFIEKLQADKCYPFSAKETQSPNLSLNLFNHSAFIVEEELKVLETNNNSRQIIYSLLRKVIEDGNTEFLVNHVVGLSKQSKVRFCELLDQTKLDDVIKFSSSVAERLTFLDFLHDLTQGDLSKKTAFRKELHKIIERHLWVFGEEYAGLPVTWTDLKLGNYLNELFNCFFTYKPSKKDENLIEYCTKSVKSINDLVLYNERKLGSNRREVMIVNLKAPSCAISQKEINLAERFAFEIEKSSMFPKNRESYKILFISSKMTEYAKSMVRSNRNNQNDPFLYKQMDKDGEDIRIYIMEWTELIDHNRMKLSYMSETLNVREMDVQAKFMQEYPDLIEMKNRPRLSQQKGSN